ncbi:hypothetical protein ETSB_0655 [cyanobacterium endosymbiont of Epithemia turgida isolate EtSB Lake Yunoko]|nr:hypothetical protein ETSB_0655 [cyanobacterium endosymbiont of Epithemia turgida isolate EtSB Lake Yunoko]
MIVLAISGVVKLASSQGQSLDELTAEVLQDDFMLDLIQRRCLSNLVEQVWQVLP